MGLLTAGMLSVLSQPTIHVVPVVTITGVGPSAATLRLCGPKSGIASESLGPYLTRVLSWGSWTRSAADLSCALSGFSGEIVIDDTDQYFGPYIHQLKRRPSTVTFVSKDVASASDFYPFHNGIVESVRPAGKGKWALYLRQDDSLLKTPFTKEKITADAWPLAHASALGKPLPVIYGSHSMKSVLGSANGMLACPYVDTTNAVFVVAAHRVKAINFVYLNGTAQTGGGVNYNIETPIVGGRQYTTLKFVSAVGTDPFVTADVDGIETVGDGSGTLITNLADQLLHMLNNWSLGDYRSGPWLGNAAQIDAALFSSANTYIAGNYANGVGGCRRIGEVQRSGEDEINQWAADLQVPVIWTNAGKIGPLGFQHGTQGAGIYPTARIRESVDVIGGQIGLSSESDAYTPKMLTSSIPWVDAFGSEHFLRSQQSQDATSALTVAQQERRVRWYADGAYTAGVPTAVTYGFLSQSIDGRRANRYRALLGLLECTLPLRYLDYELGSDFLVTWSRGQNEDGTVGWGEKPWQARLFRLVAVTVDLDRLQIKAKLQDLKPVLSTQHRVWKNTFRVGPQEEGTFRLAMGAGENYTRASHKWPDDPSGLITSIDSGIPPHDAAGLTIESAATNTITRSSGVSGTTGLTLAGTGVNGSSIAADTSVVFFETVSRFTGHVFPTGSLKMLAGTPHAADQSIQYPGGTGFLANEDFRFSIDHLDNSGADLKFRIQRSVDSQWWTGSGSTWGAGVTDIAITNDVVKTRRRFKGNVGGSNTNLTLYVVQLSGGTSGRANWVGHVQLEKGGFTSTRMVSDGSAFTRSADQIYLENTWASGDVIPVLHGTIEFVLQSWWNEADVAASDKKYIFDLQYDASNWFACYYDQASALIKFEIRAAGTTYTASGPAFSWSARTDTKVAVRWTGTEGELNLTPLTASVFINGVKGTDVVYVTPTTAASKKVYIGQKTGTPPTNQWDGPWVSYRISPFCFPDGAISLSLPI